MGLHAFKKIFFLNYVASCTEEEDIIFVLSYSATFNTFQLRGVLGSLQLVSAALRNNSNVRSALVHYEIDATLRRRGRPVRVSKYNQDSGYVYNFTSSCNETVTELDRYAGNLMENGRSFNTSSSSALKFIADHVPIDSTRRASIVTITDGFSDSDDRLKEIAANITNIKAKSDNVRFFSIGIKAQQTDRKNDLKDELVALANQNKSANSKYIEYNEFADTLLNTLEDAGILCPNQSKYSLNFTPILNWYIFHFCIVRLLTFRPTQNEPYSLDHSYLHPNILCGNMSPTNTSNFPIAFPLLRLSGS